MAKDKAADSAAAEQPATQAAPEHHLVVVHPFDAFRRGDIITEPAMIELVKSGPNSHHCHKVQPQ